MSGACSLKTRSDKKLSEKYEWFKKKKAPDEVENVNDNDPKKACDRKWHHYKKRKAAIKAIEAQDSEKVDLPPKAVLFVNNTPNGELASEIKKIVADLKPWTGFSLKIV